MILYVAIFLTTVALGAEAKMGDCELYAGNTCSTWAADKSIQALAGRKASVEAAKNAASEVPSLGDLCVTASEVIAPMAKTNIEKQSFCVSTCMAPIIFIKDLIEINV